MTIIFEWQRLGPDVALNDSKRTDLLRALTGHCPLYQLFCRDSEFVNRWFFPRGIGVGSDDLLAHLNQDALIYWNGNLLRNAQTQHMQVADEVEMGTVLLMEQPWIARTCFSEFVEEWLRVELADPYLQRFVDSLPIKSVPSDTKTSALISALPERLRSRLLSHRDLSLKRRITLVVNAYLDRDFSFYSRCALF